MAAYTAIDDSGLHYKTKIYAGTGSTATITGVGFQPDLTWIKDRDDTFWHNWVDSVRGYNKYIFSNVDREELAFTDRLTSWNSDGFVLSTDGNVNQSGQNYASYNWKGGTTSGIDTTSSTITPTGYSFNQTAGFSIIQYEGNETGGALLPHGLAVAPHFALVKSVDGTSAWNVYHKDIYPTDPEDYYLIVSSGTAKVNDAAAWNDTAPTSVNMCLGSSGSTNAASTMIAYFFTGKQGFSKFGSFTGNANADGTFIYTGFRPALIIVKDTVAAENWLSWDNKRLGYNPDNNTLYPSLTAVESTADYIDILSNGFKFRSATYNAANVQVYAAFAEAPFVNSNGVPCNAR